MSAEKKIIIDEDWKSQVQAEKEAAANVPAGEKPAPGPSGDFEMPPASLEMLVTTLATEALMALGQLPHPQTGEPIFAPQQAKYLIDTVELLSEKTKGNTTPQEAQLMDEILHQLRMVYVQVAGIEPAKPPTPGSS
jgi:hypothetical protein